MSKVFAGHFVAENYSSAHKEYVIVNMWREDACSGEVGSRGRSSIITFNTMINGEVCEVFHSCVGTYLAVRKIPPHNVDKLIVSKEDDPTSILSLQNAVFYPVPEYVEERIRKEQDRRISEYTDASAGIFPELPEKKVENRIMPAPAPTPVTSLSQQVAQNLDDEIEKLKAKVRNLEQQKGRLKREEVIGFLDGGFDCATDDYFPTKRFHKMFNVDLWDFRKFREVMEGAEKKRLVSIYFGATRPRTATVSEEEDRDMEWVQKFLFCLPRLWWVLMEAAELPETEELRELRIFANQVKEILMTDD